MDALNLPVVNVSGIELAGVDFPRVSTDQGAASALAAEHLLTRGFRNFAYFALVGIEYVSAHRRAFEAALADAGCACSIFEVPPNLGAEPDWNLDIKRIGSWLAAQPKPVAAFVWNTSSARELLYACSSVGLSVPLEVAVLSGSDDDLFCEIAPVPISAVRLPAREIGYRAAKELEAMIRDPGNPPPADVRIPPLGVRVRQSTDTLAIQDTIMVKALQFIRSEVGAHITVEDVAKYTGICRRNLESKFRTELGFSPAEEIRRVRVNRAIELLRLSNLSINEVAARAGFKSAEYMSVVFRKVTGTSPKNFRENAAITPICPPLHP